jgi:hypothetical protein
MPKAEENITRNFVEAKRWESITLINSVEPQTMSYRKCA